MPPKQNVESTPTRTESCHYLMIRINRFSAAKPQFTHRSIADSSLPQFIELLWVRIGPLTMGGEHTGEGVILRVMLAMHFNFGKICKELIGWGLVFW